MSEERALRGRLGLWIGFLAVFAALAVLLVLQYRWLVSLQTTSAMAHRATLKNYLEAITTETQYYYRSLAERSLNVPPSVFTEGPLEKAAAYFYNKPVGSAGRLFVVALTGPRRGEALMYDPASGAMGPAPDLPETRAVGAAGEPWLQMSARHNRMASTALTVDERNPRHRVVLNPITDDRAQVVGLAALVVDADHFRTSVLPGVVRKSLPEFFSGRASDNLVVTVTDGEGQVVLATDDRPVHGEELSTSFPFLFYDWRISLRGRHATPEQWARANFLVNLTLSGLLAVIVMGGLALALRAATRAVRLSQMKSDFVSNVSHELRTPLASIRVFGEFLRLGRATTVEKVREYGEYIETESRRLTQLVNNILDFSKIESGHRVYRMDPVDLRDLIASVLMTLDVRLRHGGFTWSFDTPGPPVPRLRADADALGQAIHNLLDNAMKYSADSRVIRVTLEPRDGEAVISIADSGIGIARGEQQKIFERFHRVQAGLVHDVKGSGLGLSIVSHVLRAHGGRVTVESEPGKGSTFAIHLPLPPPGTTVSGLHAAGAVAMRVAAGPTAPEEGTACRKS